MVQQEVIPEQKSQQHDRHVSMRISSISVTGFFSDVSDVTGIESSNFVSLESICGSSTSIVSAFASLELVPDVSTEMSRL